MKVKVNVKKFFFVFLFLVPVSLCAQNEENSMINVRKVRFPVAKPPIALVEKMLDSMNVSFHSIAIANWAAYPYIPEVKFRIAYSKDEIYLQFVVNENAVRAIYSDDETSKPYEDSCVEFFWTPGSDNIYYNLEFNAVGTLLYQGGAQRGNRHRFSNEVTEQIRRSTNLPKQAFDTREDINTWQLTAAIPLSIFSLGTVEPLEGRTVKANFYKCGDKLPVPHYLSWSPIGTERPNFHTPQYFGNLCFE